MEGQLYKVKIDVTKIDKARLFEGKNGAKYLDLVLFPSKNSRYGETHLVKQQVTKEERLARKEMPILGDAKPASNQPRPPVQPSKTDNQSGITEEDVPF